MSTESALQCASTSPHRPHRWVRLPGVYHECAGVRADPAAIRAELGLPPGGEGVSLPTPAEMLARARSKLDRAQQLLSEAAEELWSDWPPGCVMTDAQVERRTRMVKAIREAKTAIEEGWR